MWKQVRETGREGWQGEDGRLLEEEGYGRGNGQIRGEKWRGREGEGRETRGRDGSCERDKQRRKTDTRERQRWERDGGSLEVQGARTPQLF